MTALDFIMHWQGTTIAVRFTPCQWGVTSHLEIRSIAPDRAPLPITNTGYRSLFLPIGSLPDDEDQLRTTISGWIERAAQSPEWQESQARAAQGELF